MAGSVQVESLAGKVRHLEELVRRLGTRISPHEPVEPWQSLAPYISAGWVTDGATIPDSALHARFYKDRERVYMSGVLIYEGPTNVQKPIDHMPAGYIPDILQNVSLPTDPDNTTASPDDTRQLIWIGEILPITGPGRLLLDSNSDVPGGDPPVFTCLILDLVQYRVA